MVRAVRLTGMVLAWGMVLALAQSARAQNYKLDSAHSFVVFEIRHGDLTNAWGMATAPTGTVVLDADVAKVKFEVSVKADSILTGNAQRDNHLRGPDFFDARQFPSISFKSTTVKKSGDDYEVTGDFSLHGVTKPVTVTIKKTGERQGGAAVGVGTKFTIKRSEFGMGGMLNMLGDEVTIHVNLEATRA